MPHFADPWTAYAYALLRKNIKFGHSFDLAKGPFTFAGSHREIASFALRDNSQTTDPVREQVRVLFTNSKPMDAHTGAVSIQSADGRDRLVLALVPPGPTLRETWDLVVGESAKAVPSALPRNANFQVPIVRFFSEHRFSEMEGGLLDVGREQPAVLRYFQQDTTFELSESGVQVESTAVIAAPRGATQSAHVPPLWFVFNRPFMIGLVQGGGNEPYLLLWVNDDSILAPYLSR
jgi:hypothetical protein